MNSASRWTRLAAVVAMFGVSGLLGLALSGCSPAPEKSQPSTNQSAAPQTEEPAQSAVEEPAEPPAPEAAQPSAEEPKEKPAPEPMKTPADEPAAKPAPETPAAPAAEPTEKPAPEPMKTPAAKPASEAPAAPAATPAKSEEKPAAAPEKPQEKPAAEPTKAEEKPAAEPAKTEEKPAAAPEKPQEKPAAEPAKTEEKPAAMPAETNEKPAAEPAKAEEKPAADSADIEINPPKVSSYAPAADLASQVPEYLDEMEDAVKDEDEYADSQTKLIKDANVLILISLALGLNDQDSQYKKAAPAMIKAAQELAATTDYASAKAAVQKLKEAAASNDGDPSTLKWTKVASMPQLMKAVPLIHSRLKRYIRGSRFKSKADVTKGLTAVLAVVAQGSMPNAEDTKKPNQVEEWHKFCAQMRHASAEVHAAIVAQNEEAKDAAMEKLQQSCDDCHAVFHPEPLPEIDEQQ